MALTEDIIKANSILAPLTPEQIAAITSLSANDETSVIASKIGELHGRYDADVKAVSGLDRQQGEKSYDYTKRVIESFKGQVSEIPALKTSLKNYEAEIASYKQQIAEGKGNELINKQLKDAQTEIAALKEQHSAAISKYDADKEAFASQLKQAHIDAQIERAADKIKFKAGYTEHLQSILLSSVKNSILSTYTPDWLEENGKKTLVFRDKTGEIARNKANALNPYSLQELMHEGLKDAIEISKPVTGAGTQGAASNAGGHKDISLVDLASAKTQVQADDLIVRHLMQQGEVRGTTSFLDKQRKLREENNVAKLPVR